MTLPASGPLSISQIQAEIDGVGTMPVTIPNADWRELAGKPTGALILPDDFWGKSALSVALIGSVSNGGSISFGAEDTKRRIFGIVSHGNVGTDPGNPSCNIGGVTTNRIIDDTTGSGSGTARGVSIFTANPSGTSGIVTFSWAPAPSFCSIYRVIGYDETPEHDKAKDSGTMNLDIPTDGLLFAASIAAGTFASGVTNRNVTNSVQVGWDTRMSLETPRSVVCTSFVQSEGGSVDVCASFSKLP